MKYQRSRFVEFLKTPFPYLSLALFLFLASTMLSTESFVTALNANPAASQSARYELCLVCSDPAATDALSDVGFTVANFLLYPVNGVTLSIGTSVPFVRAAYLVLAGIYGFFMPFLIYAVYASMDGWFKYRREFNSVYVK